MKESPAPTVSATETDSPGSSTRPRRVMMTGPSAPWVSATSAGPSFSHAAIDSSGVRPG
jgi:hypothetical protein